MTLLHPWWLAPALVLLICYFLLGRKGSSDWWRVIDARVLHYLQGDQFSSNTRHTGFLLAGIACMALSGPSILQSDTKTFKHNQGWIVIADVSRSMTLNDIAPSRLAAMRDTAIELAANANASSTTLIVYAGDAFIVAPPSFDDANFRENANLMEYGIVPSDGSNITRALALAWSVVDGSKMINARIFILSDTGGFNSRSNAAISRLSNLGHQTDLILFGSNDSENTTPFDLDNASTMAQSGGGNYVIANRLGQVNFNKLALQDNNIGKQFLTQTGITALHVSNQSHWLLLFAIPLLLLMFYRELK